MSDALRGRSALAVAALGAILVAEGHPSLTTEILALRRLVPSAESAIMVTAMLLAVSLAALAGGCRRGGLLAAPHHEAVGRRRRLGGQCHCR